jgi:hypothetical protein
MNTFPFQNSISGDPFFLSIDEKHTFNSYHDFESFSYNEDIISLNKASNIYQSTDESSDSFFNKFPILNDLNIINSNNSFPDILNSSSAINNVQLNINSEINKNRDFPLFTIKKRKRKINKNLTEKSERKYDEYNSNNKIQGYYSNFLINLLESVCKTIKRKDLIFHDIKRKYKVENAFIKETKTIEDFFTNSNDFNRNICKLIRDQKIQILIGILSKNYLFFFKSIFCAERKEKYQLKEFGLADIEIEISDTKLLFNELLEKNKSDEKLVKLLKKYARKNFFPKGENISFKCKKYRKSKNNN